MKHLSILGSTGSIGRNALKIVELFPQHFTIKVLAAKTNTDLLAAQINQFTPDLAVVFDAESAQRLKQTLGGGTKTEVLYGDEGYRAAASCEGVDIVLTAVVGAAGLKPTLAAIEAGKTIALANKETLVMAGEIVTRNAAHKGVQILPVDSEHSAIFQCLQGHRKADLAHILLTASGGPFLDLPLDEFQNISTAQALNHPNWDMGPKITIDSATLMNKGLEVLEAKSLFDISQDQIEVVIHPQSIIHSMVAYQDGAVMAQLGIPDMKAAIAYALSYPQRLPLNQPLPDFSGQQDLTFQKPDLVKFPCLALAFEACRVGKTLPAVLNAANEVAVNAFLNRKISFSAIAMIVEMAMEAHSVQANPALSDILAADQEARQKAADLVAGM
ncbi:MAG: 1-deoxy-D-xylulose-5-phosphate reductoisomerase [Deltaproteobacteria bacterium]|nr:1-deoxy-D-xylulose-5-phosphate reductoisomerase [Deltaproteobacteria bacterium]